MVTFERDETEIAELRLQILNAMMDDAEDVEQVYLSANRNEFLAAPCQPRFPLREIVDEMKLLLEEGFVEACFTNDEKQAPLDNLNLALFHHYWFSPTKRGKELWEAGVPPATSS